MSNENRPNQNTVQLAFVIDEKDHCGLVIDEKSGDYRLFGEGDGVKRDIFGNPKVDDKDLLQQKPKEISSDKDGDGIKIKVVHHYHVGHGCLEDEDVEED